MRQLIVFRVHRERNRLSKLPVRQLILPGLGLGYLCLSKLPVRQLISLELTASLAYISKLPVRQLISGK